MGLMIRVMWRSWAQIEFVMVVTIRVASGFYYLNQIPPQLSRLP